MHRIRLILLPLFLVLTLSPATAAQESSAGSDTAPPALTQADLDFYRDYAQQALDEIDADIRTIIAALEDPRSVVIVTPRGPRVIPTDSLPGVGQLDLLLELYGGERLITTVRDLAALAALERAVEGLDQAAEEALQALIAEKEEIELFLEWLEQEPVAADPGAGALLAEASVEGPYADACIFVTGYFLDRSRLGETHVVAWRDEDFDPSWARFHYASAAPNERFDDPMDAIERMRQSVAGSVDPSAITYDGGFAGFCAWAHATCPQAPPLVGGNAVCEDGAPVTE